jgi:protein SCO1
MERRTLFSAAAAARQGRANIPNVAVTDQTGRAHRFYQDLIKDRIVAINFFYARCEGICPRMTANLLKVQQELRGRVGDRLGRDIFLYSISLKPEEDTPKHLAEYARMHGIAPGSGWLLLRAKRPDMELLRARLGFKDRNPVVDADINQHTGVVKLGNEAWDKWSAAPALGSSTAITDSLLWLDPR